MPNEEVYSRELCPECGFDGGEWSPERAAAEPERLADAWRATFAGRSDEELRRRPKPDVWSAVEYTVHTAEIVRYWRESVSKLTDGEPITMSFESYPDADRLPYNETAPEAALGSLESELARLNESTASLSENQRRMPLRLDKPDMQQGWTDFGVTNVFACALHAIHDAAHHLEDIKRGLAASSGA